MAKRIISISCISIFLLLFGPAGVWAVGEEQPAVDHGVNQGHQDPVAPSPDQPMDHSQMSVQEHSASGGEAAPVEGESHQAAVEPPPAPPVDHSQMSVQEHSASGGDAAPVEGESHQETVDLPSDQPIDHSQMSVKEHDEAGTANDASGEHSAGSPASGGHGSSEKEAVVLVGPDWPVIYGFAAINFLILFTAAVLKPRRAKAEEVL